MTAFTNRHSNPQPMKSFQSCMTPGSSALPDVIPNIYARNQSSFSGALEPKTKELIALAIAIVTHCDDCVTFHTHAVLKAGATQEEILEMLGITVLMSEGSALTDATQVMEAVEALQQSEQ